MKAPVLRAELRLREQIGEYEPGASMRSPERVAAVIGPELRTLTVEQFWVLVVDGKHRLSAAVRVSEGTLTASIVHPREVFRPAVLHGGAAILLVHNHPSGDPGPSTEDVEVTRRMVEVGRLLGIPVLDHVIIGSDDPGGSAGFDGCPGYVSLRERGVVS